MSICQSCVEHEVGYLWNNCKYYKQEYYYEPDECDAYNKINKNNKEVKENEISICHLMNEGE